MAPLQIVFRFNGWLTALVLGVLCMAEAAGARPAGLLEPLSVSLDAYQGLSGLALDGDGHLWSIGERQRRLVEMEIRDNQLLSIRERPLTGVPRGVDIESLAWSGEFLFLGTERHAPGAADSLLQARVDSTGATVIGTLPLDYQAIGLSASVNQGIEGLCAAEGMLVAAIEAVLENTDGGRLAPVAVFDHAQSRWRFHRVRLTSTTGKLSALACRATGAELEVYAIERHFGVSRLIRFSLPLRPQGVPSPKPTTAVVVVDLTDQIDAVVNLEGMAWVSPDIMLLLSDNQWGRSLTETRAFRLRLPQRSGDTP
jgi:hypothetical protein